MHDNRSPNDVVIFERCIYIYIYCCIYVCIRTFNTDCEGRYKGRYKNTHLIIILSLMYDDLWWSMLTAIKHLKYKKNLSLSCFAFAIHSRIYLTVISIYHNCYLSRVDTLYVLLVLRENYWLAIRFVWPGTLKDSDWSQYLLRHRNFVINVWCPYLAGRCVLQHLS